MESATESSSAAHQSTQTTVATEPQTESRIPTSPVGILEKEQDKEKDKESFATAESTVDSAPARDDEKAVERSLKGEKDSAPSEPTSSGTNAEDGTVVTSEKKDGAETTETPAKEAAAEGEDRAHRNHLTGVPLAMLTFGLCTSTFVIALDNTIIATAIPAITTYFNSLDDVGWYGSAYLLTTTALQPSFGKVYAYFNIKWTYLFALAIFEVGSVLCAAAKNSEMLIVGRAVAGVGAAALFSGGMTIVGYSVPLHKRAIYIALLSSMFGISSVVGPILGGAFTDRVSWRWCFWINLPFGGISLAAVFFCFKNPEREHNDMTFKDKLKQIDFIGAFFLISAIVCLLLALQWGGITYAWKDSKVWGCILGFGLLIILFVGQQFRRQDIATLPPRILLKQRTVFASAWFSTFLAMAMYTHIFYLPFYFQSGKSTSAEGSGIRIVPYLVSNTIASILVGGLITVWGPYTPFMWIGSAIFTIGSGMLYTLKVASPAGQWIGYQILTGFGSGACVQIPFIAVQVVLSEADMPIGNAIAIFFNSLGGAVSISVAQNIFANTLVKRLPIDAPGLNPLVVIGAGATELDNNPLIPKEALPGVLEAYVTAVTTAFVLPIAVGGLAFFVSFLMEWKSVKGKNLMGGGAA